MSHTYYVGACRILNSTFYLLNENLRSGCSLGSVHALKFAKAPVQYSTQNIHMITEGCRAFQMPSPIPLWLSVEKVISHKVSGPAAGLVANRVTSLQQSYLTGS